MRSRIGAALLSPQAMLGAAILVLLPYLILHIAGVRDSVVVFSGTIPVGEIAEETTQLAVAYVASYLIAVVVVPILVIGAVIFWIYQRLYARKRE